jgi:2,3-bisphosphoglycerate-independent phosphoglycerate mutase
MKPRLKGVLVILDGLGDRPVERLGDRTPLEAATTIHLDRLVETGQCGLVDPLSPGIPVDTAAGTGLLLGASPHAVASLSRGPVEAAGVGLEIAPGDLALRCNFATVEREDGRLLVLDRRAGRIRSATDELSAVLQDVELGDGITATLMPATQHRAVLRLSGQGLSAEISDTDPGIVPLPAAVLKSKAQHRGDPRSAKSAAAVNRFVEEAHRRLDEHPVNRDRADRGLPPANGVITRGAGLATTGLSVIEQLGLTATVVAGESTVIGLAALLGLRSVTDPRFTGLTDTDVAAKIESGLAALEDADIAVVHIKGPDICSHDLDPEGKRAFLEVVDGALQPLLDRGFVIGVTGDHSSDSTTGSHSGDPVPAILNAPGGRRDSTTVFGERACMTGGLGRLTSSTFVMSFLDAMGAVPEWRAGSPAYGPDAPERGS